MTHIANYQNCDLVTGFLDELPTLEAKRSETISLLATLAPYVPRTKLEEILDQKRHAKQVLTGTVFGEAITDPATGKVEHRPFFSGEGNR